MTSENEVYRWQRRYVFAVTLAIVVALPVLIAMLA